MARLWAKFLLLFVVTSSALTGATLLIVRNAVREQVRGQIVENLRASVDAFQNVQRQWETAFTRMAALVAELPSVKALMSTQDPATIQDASASLRVLSGSDLFVLADRVGNVVALHAVTPGLSRRLVQDLMHSALEERASHQTWFARGQLYQVFLQPIYLGTPSAESSIGTLGIGHEINDDTAREVGRIASSEVVFHQGMDLVATTLSLKEAKEFSGYLGSVPGSAARDPQQIQLGSEDFLAASVDMASDSTVPLRLTVLISYDKATAFLASLNRLLLALGVLAVLGGSGLVLLISRSMTRPLANLVAGVRALEHGDYAYPLAVQTADEVAEVTRAFEHMRVSLRTTQRQLLEAERLATIGRMASSISHDLRHPLAAIVANAEFLSDGRLNDGKREDLYQEIRWAVAQTTDLVDSLLEFSLGSKSVHRTFGRVEEAVEHAILSVKARPEFHPVNITVRCQGKSEGWFDPRKVERGLTNILLNACEAVSGEAGAIEVDIREAGKGVEIRIADNGPGIPQPIRDNLFEPFVSYGKQAGTGLGLAAAQKIFRDQGGSVALESTTPGRTIFKLILPLSPPPEPSPAPPQ